MKKRKPINSSLKQRRKQLQERRSTVLPKLMATSFNAMPANLRWVERIELTFDNQGRPGPVRLPEDEIKERVTEIKLRKLSIADLSRSLAIAEMLRDYHAWSEKRCIKVLEERASIEAEDRSIYREDTASGGKGKGAANRENRMLVEKVYKTLEEELGRRPRYKEFSEAMDEQKPLPPLKAWTEGTLKKWFTRLGAGEKIA
jgi:hypothetical protein